MNAIEVKSLTKVYDQGRKAVDSIDFEVKSGEIFGFLGPNGAGKSTTIKMLTGVLKKSSGSILIQGQDISRDRHAKQLIGYIPQDFWVDDNLNGWNNLFLQAKFYGLTTKDAKERIRMVLDVVNLTDRANDLVETYSGGMRKRLDIACGIVHNPRILIMDEPTLGLDIQTRREIWKFITRMKDENGMTIFLTTHYMEEADQLCDRIAIIDQGVIKTIDTPLKLKTEIGGDIISVTFSGDAQAIEEAVNSLRELESINQVNEVDGVHIFIVNNSESAMPQIFETINGHDVKIMTVTASKPNLDDVYVSYTGRNLRDTGEEERKIKY